MADRYLLESGAPDGYLLEDGTGVLLMEPFVPNAESDDWWAGSALSFAAVAVVGAAALLASNTAIARTFVHQDEVPAAAATPASADSSIIPTQRARISPVFQKWFAQDELPVQAATSIVEEEYDWKPLVPASAPFGATPQWDDQALSWSIDEQYSWTAGWTVSPVTPRIEHFWHQDEAPATAETPVGETSASIPTQRARVSPIFQRWFLQDELPAQAAVSNVDDEYDWKPQALLSAPVGATPQWDDQALSWSIDEQYEWAPCWVAAQVSSLPFFDSDALPVALDEDPWAVPVFTAQKVTVLSSFEDEGYSPPALRLDDGDGAWPLFSHASAARPVVVVWNVENEPFVLGAFTLHEDDSAVSAVAIPSSNVIVWATDEEIVPQVGVFTPHEDDSAVSAVAVSSSNVIVWATDEEIVPQVAASSTGGGVLKEKVNVVHWHQEDSFPVSAAAFTLHEDDSTISVAAVQSSNVIVWAENEQIVPQPTFDLEEFESPLFVPALVKTNAPLWFGDDERITFVAPTPAFEDDSWNSLRSVPVDLAPYFAMLFQGSTDDGSIVVTEPPPPPTGTHTWLLVKRRTRR